MESEISILIYAFKSDTFDLVLRINVNNSSRETHPTAAKLWKAVARINVLIQLGSSGWRTSHTL